jgi:phage terminase large subunit-like protein
MPLLLFSPNDYSPYQSFQTTALYGITESSLHAINEIFFSFSKKNNKGKILKHIFLGFVFHISLQNRKIKSD